MSTKLSTLFQSRRFYAALIGLTTVVVSTLAHVDPQTVESFAWIIAGWIVGDSIKNTE